MTQTSPTFLVIQQGGSSCEWYAGFYDDQDQAVGAIKGHRDASYDAIGPFKLEQPYTNDQLQELGKFFEHVAAHAVDLGGTLGGFGLVGSHQAQFGL